MRTAVDSTDSFNSRFSMDTRFSKAAQFGKRKKKKPVQLDERFKDVPDIDAPTDAKGRVVVKKHQAEATTKDEAIDTEVPEYAPFAWDAESSSEEEDEVEETEADLGIPETPLVDNAETARLALKGLVWETLKAKDVFAIMTSFLSKGNILETEKPVARVRIFQSEFGKEKMQRDKERGAPYDAKDPEDIRHAKYRAWLREKSMYFFAIVDCEDKVVADRIYEEFDGTDVSWAIDGMQISFVPDDLVIPGEPTDTCEEFPKRYTPPAAFKNYLQTTTVDETAWDEDPPDRTRFFKKLFTEKEVLEMEYKNYVKVSSDEEESSVEAIAEFELPEFARDRADEEAESVFDASGNVVTAASLTEDNLEVYRKRLLEGVDSEDADSDSEDIRLVQEKAESTDVSDSEEMRRAFAAHDMGIEEPEAVDAAEGKGEGDGRKRKRFPLVGQELSEEEEEEEDEKPVAPPSSDSEDDFKMKGPKRGKKKAKRRRDQQDTFNLDTEDPRFQAVYEEPEFALDPTSPEFRNNQATQTMLKTKKKRRVKK